MKKYLGVKKAILGAWSVSLSSDFKTWKESYTNVNDESIKLYILSNLLDDIISEIINWKNEIDHQAIKLETSKTT